MKLTFESRLFISGDRQIRSIFTLEHGERAGEALEMFSNIVMASRFDRGLTWADVSLILADMRTTVAEDV